ncbi:ras-related protein Rab-34-like isoform X4 [Tachypleus tridentatus]|uniref:ras-related protein Rab-34-like isoform X4 n=1 Tax=Tachypleus tridentatus TaxID=6853 RepID=UPI003FD67A41
MTKRAATQDRIIYHYPLAFLPDATPYTDKDFDRRVRKACESERVNRIGLKISKTIFVGDVAVGKTFLVNRWDTAGQERFKSISAAYYRGTKGENIMEFFSRLAALCFNYSVHREMEVLQRSEVSKDFVKLSEYGKKREENF